MVYFDNASTTYPKPLETLDSIKKAVLVYGGNPSRSAHSLALKTSEKVYNVRLNIANFFGADVEDVIFTLNCTHSLNMAIKGTLTHGNVIISCYEHNAVTRPIYSLKESGITCTVADIHNKNDDEIVEEFSKHIKFDTKAIICTHVSNVIGKILPIRRIGKICKDRKIMFIVDASQSSGVLDINIKRDNIDILCTSGHKGLYGCTGTGLMILSKNVNIKTIIEGGTGSLSSDIRQPNFKPDKFESGTLNTVGIMSLDSGIKFIKQKGMDKIYNYEFKLSKLLYDSLKSMNNVVLYSDTFEKDDFVPIVAFNVDNYDSFKAVEYFNNNGFALRGGIHCSLLCHDTLQTTKTGLVRFSPSTFNTFQEVENFISCIRKM